MTFIFHTYMSVAFLYMCFVPHVNVPLNKIRNEGIVAYASVLVELSKLRN
jgi:hypothetical protein